ncbi:hypothetical protein CDAR_533371 [Caerostris darwini]|uniref:Uncharacterized protein n=1 Tax=Caerostris darwini TaxID=1538125 RepID=A0AAV4MSD5_9ARAC|nr:hypothetical protein CDAR_533371 [Caerostris darwini]
MISQIATSSQCIMGYELDVIPFRRRYGLCANELPVSDRFYEFINGSLYLFFASSRFVPLDLYASVKLEMALEPLCTNKSVKRIALWPKVISGNGA